MTVGSLLWKQIIVPEENKKKKEKNFEVNFGFLRCGSGFKLAKLIIIHKFNKRQLSPESLSLVLEAHKVSRSPLQA